jgi:hypothetical protein
LLELDIRVQCMHGFAEALERRLEELIYGPKVPLTRALFYEGVRLFVDGDSHRQAGAINAAVA